MSVYYSAKIFAQANIYTSCDCWCPKSGVIDKIYKIMTESNHSEERKKIVELKERVFQLTKDLEQLKNFCDNWENQCGGDGAEDWVGGYKLALDKIKWRNGRKIYG